LAHITLRHRRTQTVLVMPALIQAALFRVVVAVGTVLGRYRGTDWPGCPRAVYRCSRARGTLTSGWTDGERVQGTPFAPSRAGAVP
jgi:hypothetical protein